MIYFVLVLLKIKHASRNPPEHFGFYFYFLIKFLKTVWYVLRIYFPNLYLNLSTRLSCITRWIVSNNNALSARCVHGILHTNSHTLSEVYPSKITYTPPQYHLKNLVRQCYYLQSTPFKSIPIRFCL